MTDVRSLIESERALERRFVAGDRPEVKGWTVATTMFHLVKWRERLITSLEDLRDGRPPVPPPENVDELNDSELTGAAGVPLAESARRADELLASLLAVYESVGERPFHWYRRRTTAEAVLGNSYTHPRFHITAYLRENGDMENALQLCEATVSELRRAEAAAPILGNEQYNLACALVGLGRRDEALAQLAEGVSLLPRLKEFATTDPDLEPLKGDPRFEALISS
jgi:hypothetical protein